MSDMDTHDPLDRIVGDALRADAEQAPALAADWPGIDRMSTSPSEHRPRRFTYMACAAAVALVVAGLTAVAVTRNSEVAPASSPPSWVPDGTEFPLTDLGPATAVVDGPVVEALTRQVGVPGHPPQIITTSLTYDGKNTATEQFCTWEDGSGGCRPDWGASWSTSQTSSIDNRVANYDLWTIDGLPADAAFVSYGDGDQHLWQRPIAGFAAFPNVEGHNEVVIAYDQFGDELARYGITEYEAAFGDIAPPLEADLSKAEYRELIETTTAAMSACLTVNGGTITGKVATFADGIDQVAIWNNCVAAVKEEVAAAVNEIDPRYFDPATERPESPEPAKEYTNFEVPESEPETVAPSSSLATDDTGVATSGDTATWTVDPGAALTSATTTFSVSVTRLGCAGGVTGDVLEPVIVTEADQVVITLSVDPLDPTVAYTCPTNDSRSVVVHLDEPLGNRNLVDGACLGESPARQTSFCETGAVRFQAPS